MCRVRQMPDGNRLVAWVSRDGVMPDLVGVHGIGKQQLGRHQLLGLWSRALADGLERASGCADRHPEDGYRVFGDLVRPWLSRGW